MEYLDKMRELCAENGVELILVKAPTNSWRYYWHDEWEEQIVDYADEHSLRYYNLINSEEEIGIDWSTDTYDAGAHLNVYGAEKTTRFFGAILKDVLSLDDRRGDAELSAIWDQRVDRYYEERNKEGETK